MSQEKVFMGGEADRWFQRNREAISAEDRPDWPLELISKLGDREKLSNFLELGCSNGWRLARLRAVYGKHNRYVGVDPSGEALDQGRLDYPGVEFHPGLLSDIPVKGEFDLVVVNYVLHWVDRASLAKSVSEVDRLVADGGYLILGDFLPDYAQRKAYHHLPDSGVYTYKQDYPRIFTALGTYSELTRVTHGHAADPGALTAVPSGERAVCCLLRKSLNGYYAEMA